MATALLELPVDRRRDARALRMALTAVASLGLALMLGSFLGWMSTDLSAEDVAELAALVETERPTVVEHDVFDGDRLDPSKLPAWKLLLLGDDRFEAPVDAAVAEWHSFVPEPDRPPYAAAAEEGLAAAGWEVLADDGAPDFVEATKDGVTVDYYVGATFGRVLAVRVEPPSWTVVVAMVVLPILVMAGLFALGRREKRQPAGRQRLSLGLSIAGSVLLLPSAACAPTFFAEEAWTAGRLYDLRLGLLLNLGIALWIAAVALAAIPARADQYSGNAQPPG
ncbi:hypothetical protein [Phytomonospora endophytica]|uniref:Uncharacterized protein n=1 Tax=Phytomonospora endophytica TaxID=714109 RepID=A0A841FA60_9ACTN|nr:hypothetical protein [Phytomonospora endophytica]MBB6034131.1 hypothetical protein [Phytomonospora endophytica]GIG66523.1 hypothetical protein Pen01_28180 [Phytomonospora endophytica]